jgi:dihydropteroate synthase
MTSSPEPTGPADAVLLRARQFEFRFPRPTLVLGIVNVTPDSFSDGGRFMEPEMAIAHGLRLAEGGADILDIGGESTRPRSTPVSESEELRRVLPVIQGLAARVQLPLSIDTMKPGVARAALEAGASIVNDVGANRDDNEMWRVTAEAGAGYICVHMQGIPQNMQQSPSYGDVVQEVTRFFEERLARLGDCGVTPDRTILDPGIGFGKTFEHNWRLLGGLRGFARLRRPVCLGVSRKSFLSKLPNAELAGRLPGGLACACMAAGTGVEMIRTHDVLETVQALRATEIILANR